MIISAEISLYPLSNEYKDIIYNFIDKLKSNKNLKVISNGMSTQLFGDYQEVTSTLNFEMKSIFEMWNGKSFINNPCQITQWMRISFWRVQLQHTCVIHVLPSSCIWNSCLGRFLATLINNKKYLTLNIVQC